MTDPSMEEKEKHYKSNARKRVEELEKQLAEAKEELERVDEPKKPGVNGLHIETNTDESEKDHDNDDIDIVGHPAKRGYLSKWQTRTIGWGGTKWDLRFVVLEQGRLAYYRTHRDIAPRYVLVLNGCAVRDEGFKSRKSVRDHIPMINALSGPSDESQITEDFHVFSIYQRPKNKHHNHDHDEDHSGGQQSAEADDESEITPLLRFSTESKAEKMQWMDFISEACAYCESEAFLNSPKRNQSVLLDQLPAAPPLQLEPGKLAPLYFGKPRIIKLPAEHEGANANANKRRKRFLKRSHSTRVTQIRSTYPPSRPMHQSSGPFYLSDESQSPNFRGLLNLAFIMLVISHFNILLHTIKANGSFLAKISNIPLDDFIEAPLEQFPFFTGMLLLSMFFVYSYVIELQLCNGRIREFEGMLFHYINATLSLLVPFVIVWYFIPNPVAGAALCITSTIAWMKLMSYALANCDYRTSKQDSYQATLALITDLDDKASKMSYPNNVTLSNIFYFWFAPTLTYQMAYPKSPKIRWTKVITLMLRLVVAIAMLVFLSAQIIVPNLDLWTQEYKTYGKISLNAECLTKLALASTYTWLLFFYTYFHLFLNLIAELLQFGDRVFYKDWWNASEVSAYWRLWNMPVHYWLIRHVYFPCIRMRMSKNAATFVVFFVSAVLHEVLISVPFHIVSFWSFFGMMGQLPLITFTKYFDKKFQGSSIGNIIFWLSFCVVGQPTAILLYTIDFWDKDSNETVASDSVTQCIGSECEL